MKKKKVLFFSPAFFGYEKAIVDKLIELNYEVDYFDERSITKNVEKALLKVVPSFFNNKSQKYYQLIFDKIKDKEYDIVFFIKGDSIPLDMLDKFRSHYSQSIFLLYLWDSIRNIKNIENKFLFFDKIYSFDNEDVKKNANLIFRPLFYIDEYKKDFSIKASYEYDISFCGTIHSDRYRVIKEISNFAKENYLKTMLYSFLQGKFIYYFYKFTKKEFFGTKISEFDFEKISGRRIAEIVDSSRVILDIQHPEQTGLTIRTIEMVGMHKKLITTNKEIAQYDFYNPKNICIIDRKNPKLPIEFFNSNYEPVSKEVYDNYSLESWIKEILN